MREKIVNTADGPKVLLWKRSAKPAPAIVRKAEEPNAAVVLASVVDAALELLRAKGLTAQEAAEAALAGGNAALFAAQYESMTGAKLTPAKLARLIVEAQQ